MAIRGCSFLAVLYAVTTWGAVFIVRRSLGSSRRGAGMSERPPIVVRLLKGFGRFWWDFLVGDTPELFVAVVVIVGGIAILSEVGHFNVACDHRAAACRAVRAAMVTGTSDSPIPREVSQAAGSS